MTLDPCKTGRRSFLTAAAAAGLVAMSGAAVASSEPVDPWVTRELYTWEKHRLATLAEKLNDTLADLPVETRVLPGHLRVRIPASLAYVPGKDALNPDGVAVLTLVAEKLADQKRVSVEIVGHHDTRANDYEAYVFTQRRAVAAKSALESRGISPARLKATGLGMKFPFTDGGSAENQRIELIIRPV
ncbi:OmpA family protein [Leisingera sp. XS_AS12]|uniref:OmpA family protein n=1 Tax=Leisingera TaxID=191028 RepID=UPI0003F65717|nr:OmpA family protein [Leisingera caerulea]